MTKEETTTYEIEFDNKTKKRITVPSSWKVTFGPASAGNQKGHSQFKMPLALRFYENKDRQRAIFTDVASFRDLSIKLEEEVVNTRIKEGFVEVDGARKATSFSATTKEWVDQDRAAEQDTNKLLMPSDMEMSLEEE